VSAPFREGNRYFFFKNDGLQNQSVLYTAPSLEDDPRILIDPNLFSQDGTMALKGVKVSHDGKLIAYGVSDGGSDWVTWRVKNIATGEDTRDELKWIKWGGVAWTHDGRGFYYSRYDEPEGEALEAKNFYNKLYYHVLGTNQSEDELVLENADEKEWGFGARVSDDGRYLIVTVWKGTGDRYRVFYKDLGKNLRHTSGGLKPLVEDFAAEYAFVGNDGSELWFKTDRDAPQGKVVAVDVNPRGAKKGRVWRDRIAQAAETLVSVAVVGDRFFVHYLQDAHSVVRVHHTDGRFERDLPLPGLGSVRGFNGKRSHPEAFFGFTSFARPTTVFRYQVDDAKTTVWRAPKVKFTPDDYVTTQVFYQSRDGTRVPMFISHKKGLALDGKAPTYLYGYGGFNIPITPSFKVNTLQWMEMGGIYAVANLRGGGEYGAKWHEAGTRLRKQNVFDDFIAAAEYLIDEGYTSQGRLAIGGRSNGGLLVGASITQRPDLFAAALPAVGVMDMLRFNKFTIGWAWEDDYGSPENPEEFRALRAYSPLHNVKQGTHYPATLVTTADRDDRVVPGHSFKFAAALQAANEGTAPVMIRIETRAGHGSGTPTQKLIEEAADKWTFLTRVLAMDTDSVSIPEEAPRAGGDGGGATKWRAAPAPR
jgi:prolyl oligopeptidase